MTLSTHAVRQALKTCYWFPVAVILILLRPIVHIEFVPIFPARIGPFIARTLMAQASATRLQLKKRKRVIAIACFDRDASCNIAWNYVVREFMPVAPRAYSTLGRWQKRLAPKTSIQPRNLEHWDTDYEGLLREFAPRITLPDGEIEKALLPFRHLGFDPSDPFICIHVRDSAYLNPCETKDDNHAYRDSPLGLYTRSIELLLDKGFWVFRTGRRVRQPLQINHQRIIDYATSPSQSDWLDIWLFTNAYATISTGSGPDYLSYVAGKPVLLVNFLPLIGAWQGADLIAAPKLLYSEDGRRLDALQQMAISLLSTNAYSKAGISIRDLNSLEILRIVQDFLSFCESRSQSEVGAHYPDRYKLSHCSDSLPVSTNPWRLTSSSYAYLSRAWPGSPN